MFRAPPLSPQVLFRGKNGTCAHEFILDFRPLKDSSGIEVEVGGGLEVERCSGGVKVWDLWSGIQGVGRRVLPSL